MPYKAFEFTAFCESDLVNGNLNFGDDFIMPASATTYISVIDNDKFLSADYHKNENASDHLGQHAFIEKEGYEVGNGSQIYAENYYWVKDQDGNVYIMLKIEQENSSETYFTFYTGDGYGIPPAGAELTAHRQHDVSSNWVNFEYLDAGEKIETGSISGRVFCDLNHDGIDNITQNIIKEGENLIVNGDFENNPLANRGWGLFDSIEGWHAVQGKIEIQESNYATRNTKGNAVVELDANYNSIICQNVSIPEAGTYSFSIDYAMRGMNANTNGFAIYIDGVKQAEVYPTEKGFKTLEFNIDLNVGNSSIDIKGLGKSNGIGTVIDNIELRQLIEVSATEEPSKEGVTVKLVDLDGNVVDTTTTDADGHYEFSTVATGDYKIIVVKPDGTEFTLQDVGTDDSIDSDVNANGMSGVISVTSGKNITNIDAGLKEIEPSSLSGKYFLDANGDDLDNDGTNGIEGVLVELLDDNGNLTGQTTTTAADGSYRFDDLKAGIYGVKFTDKISGKTLVDANVGNDDTIDSDAINAGNNTSIISNIMVVTGENTPDNDAGVVDDTVTAENDTTETCYDEIVKIDVLANDSDPQNDILTITEINGIAINEGGPTIDIDGVTVSLVDGQLQFDGSTAYANLKTNEKAVNTFTYTVTDTDGNTSTAEVEITFKGATDTLDKVAKLLTDTSLTMQLIDEGEPDAANVETDEMYTAKLSGSTFDGLNGTFKAAYCLNIFNDVFTLPHGSHIIDAPKVSVNAMLATENSLSTTQKNDLGIGSNGLNAEENFDLINWIINQDFTSQDNGDATGRNYTDAEIQGAIWALTDGQKIQAKFGDSVHASFGEFKQGTYVRENEGTADNAIEILNMALAKGEGFEASEGDLVGVYLDPLSPNENTQPFIVAIDLFEESIC